MQSDRNLLQAGGMDFRAVFHYVAYNIITELRLKISDSAGNMRS